MYFSVIHRIEKCNIQFSEEDYQEWVEDNPGAIHTHENYVKEIAGLIANDDDWWELIETEIVGIFYRRD